MLDDFIFQKPISKSMFTQGFTIDVLSQKIFAMNLSAGELQHGEQRSIKIFFGGDMFEVRLRSIGFERKNYPNRKDIWQINYGANHPFAKKLRAEFQNRAGYLILYATNLKDVFHLETILQTELPMKIETDEISLEHLLETDENATIIEKFGLQKVRKLNRSIGNFLKDLYEYRCQICGENIGLHYGTNVTECHHIKYFSESMNNDMNNLLVVCPNHHRIIHATNPRFDFKNKLYRYPNGLIEGLKLNMHL